MTYEQFAHDMRAALPPEKEGETTEAEQRQHAGLGYECDVVHAPMAVGRPLTFSSTYLAGPDAIVVLRITIAPATSNDKTKLRRPHSEAAGIALAGKRLNTYDEPQSIPAAQSAQDAPTTAVSWRT